jgi:hypothetical protein
VSGRLTVGVIGQPMRGAYCRALFTAAGNAPAVILTDDPGAFADWDLPPEVGVLAIDDDSVGRYQKLRRRFRRRAIEWLRSGSVVGARTEEAIRKMRPVRNLEMTGGAGADAPLRRGLITQLDSIHESSAIGQIVVFDLFDLPSVLEFSNRTGVPVVVR